MVQQLLTVSTVEKSLADICQTLNKLQPPVGYSKKFPLQIELVKERTQGGLQSLSFAFFLEGSLEGHENIVVINEARFLFPPERTEDGYYVAIIQLDCEATYDPYLNE
jgi:hypothetical protein